MLNWARGQDQSRCIIIQYKHDQYLLISQSERRIWMNFMSLTFFKFMRIIFDVLNEVQVKYYSEVLLFSSKVSQAKL